MLDMSPLFLICVRTKSISAPGNSICIRSASMFDFSIANPNSTLVFRSSLYFVTPKTPRSCRTIPIPLVRQFKQYRYHLVRQVEQMEIDSPHNIYQFIHLPFLRGDFSVASSGFGRRGKLNFNLGNSVSGVSSVLISSVNLRNQLIFSMTIYGKLIVPKNLITFTN